MATRTRFEFDTREVRELALDLGKVPGRANRLIDRVLKEESDDLKDLWVHNARWVKGMGSGGGLTASEGSHGRNYHRSISASKEGYLLYEVGPRTFGGAHHQGNMSFEYGSRNQPPHLDGNRAADVVFPRVERRIAHAAEDSFRGP